METNQLLSARARSATSSVIRDLLALVDRPNMLSLAGGLPAVELLPAERMADAAQRVLSASPTRALQYGPTDGLTELRCVLADRLRCDADGVIVTTGSQQGLDLLARVLLDPGDVVVVEDPSYLGSLQVFRQFGAELAAIAGDGDGLRVDLLEAALADGLRPKAVSVVSDFANPSGATLSTPRRHALAALAERYGFVIIEDNPYGELRWRGDTPPSLVTLTGRAVALGSASKILAPGMRVGWMRGPAWLLDAAARLKQSVDLHTSSLDQLMMADVLDDAAFMAAHLDSLRAEYARRAAALVAAVDRHAAGRLEVNTPEGGMFVWGRLVDPGFGGGSTGELFERALDAGVAFVPGHAFSVGDAVSDRLRMCFTTLGPSDLGEAVRRLASVI